MSTVQPIRVWWLMKVLFGWKDRCPTCLSAIVIDKSTSFRPFVARFHERASCPCGWTYETSYLEGQKP